MVEIPLKMSKYLSFPMSNSIYSVGHDVFELSEVNVHYADGSEKMNGLSNSSRSKVGNEIKTIVFSPFSSKWEKTIWKKVYNLMGIWCMRYKSNAFALSSDLLRISFAHVIFMFHAVRMRYTSIALYFTQWFKVHVVRMCSISCSLVFRWW